MNNWNKNQVKGSVADATSEFSQGGNVKEYNYVFRLTHEEQRIFNWYRDQIATASTGFAEIYYEYLFDNPDIADVLYAGERRGEDIGQWVRAQLGCLIGFLSRDPEVDHMEVLSTAGVRYFERGFKPVWIIVTHHLYIDHLEGLIPALKLTSGDSRTLATVLTRLLLRNLGLILESYWRAVGRHAAGDQARLDQQHGSAGDLLAALPGMFWTVDVKKERVLFANSAMVSVYSDRLESPLPTLSDTHEEDRQKLLAAWREAVDGNNSCSDVRMSPEAGDLHHYRITFYPVTGNRGPTKKIHCTLELSERAVSRREQFDNPGTNEPAANSPGREKWNSYLRRALATAKRIPDSQVAVIAVDINQFNMYNDTLGHETGDLLLRDLAGRIKKFLRESDALVRIDADRFGILLQPVSNARIGAERVVRQVLESVKLPFVCGERQLYIELSMGAACYCGDGLSAETLLSRAESALHTAQRKRQPFLFFDSLEDAGSPIPASYSTQIHTALDNNEFKLHYQPLVDMQTSTVLGAEALLRWDHPSDGMIMPDAIIPLAEQAGMIASITDWVFVTALIQSRKWMFNDNPLPVSVNVSASTFLSPQFSENIRQALDASGVDGSCLEIEISEFTLMQDVGRATGVLHQLSETGVGVVIDDFGSGCSTLSILKGLPVKTLKIAPAFITGLVADRKEAAIVRSIIDLGHTLGWKVIAKGVENDTTWDVLGDLGCDAAQGFLISKPLSGSHFTDWVNTSTPGG